MLHHPLGMVFFTKTGSDLMMDNDYIATTVNVNEINIFMKKVYLIN